MLEHLVEPLGLPGRGLRPPGRGGRELVPGPLQRPAGGERAVARRTPWRPAAPPSTGSPRTGVPPERIVLAGFSQGACLAADLLARRPGACGGGALLTGALIGPDGDVTEVRPQGGLPLFVLTSRHDGWVALDRVEATAAAFAAAGAQVELQVTEDREHRIAPAAVAGVRRLLSAAAAGRAPGAGGASSSSSGRPFAWSARKESFDVFSSSRRTR